jgi:uncharacterized zinc-type alcohol dehydrogenase-like protein
MTKVNAYAAKAPGAKLEPFTYTLGPIGADQVDIKVEYCGICHSDLSMINNDWGMSQYPLVPGHEAVGTIMALGSNAKGLKLGQRVGLGWVSGSCLHCKPCRAGDNNMCESAESTIVGRHGGFADVVRCNWEWAIALPDGVAAESAGPLFCGGITVFNPILQLGIRPTHKVGVIGLGGLGHMALMFLKHWGCEVTAFTSSPGKEAELRALGAHHVVSSRDSKALGQRRGQYDFIVSTVNVTLNWNDYLALLGPRGRLCMVGAVLEPLSIPAFSLIGGQKSISGSPVGAPAAMMDMLEFCARHTIAPKVELFKLADVNDAIAHLESGKARYRVVLKV